MKQLSDEVDEDILATNVDSEIMNKIKEEVTGGLEISVNFNETIKTIKGEVDDEADIEYTNDVPMQMFSYGSDPNSHDIGDTYDEYEIVTKVEPELEIKSDELQNELTDELNASQNYLCSQCNFVTSRKYYLDIHNEMVHSREENTDPVDYKANNKLIATHLGGERRYCDHNTLQYDSLKVHTKAPSKHPQARKCKYCDFTTPRKSSLLSHMRIHKISRTCSHCSFTSHLRTVFRKHDCFFNK